MFGKIYLVCLNSDIKMKQISGNLYLILLSNFILQDLSIRISFPMHFDLDYINL